MADREREVAVHPLTSCLLAAADLRVTGTEAVLLARNHAFHVRAVIALPPFRAVPPRASCRQLLVHPELSLTLGNFVVLLLAEQPRDSFTGMHISL